jgi:hypothetical protein
MPVNPLVPTRNMLVHSGAYQPPSIILCVYPIALAAAAGRRGFVFILYTRRGDGYQPTGPEHVGKLSDDWLPGAMSADTKSSHGITMLGEGLTWTTRA